MAERPPFVSPAPLGSRAANATFTAGNYLPGGSNRQSPFVMVAEDSYGPSLTVLSRSPNNTGVGQLPTFVGARYNTHERDSTRHAQWREDIAESLRRANISTSTLSTSPPTVASAKQQMPQATSEEINEYHNANLAEYQSVNTRIWDIVRYSIDITGLHEQADRDYMRDNFMHGDLRDGIGLYQRHDDMLNDSDIHSQIQAITDLTNFPTLSAKANLDSLITHSYGLLKSRWS